MEENEEENETVDPAAWELKAPFVGTLAVMTLAPIIAESCCCLDAPLEALNTNAAEPIVDSKEEITCLPNPLAAAQDVRVRPTTAQYYSVDGVSVEDLRPVRRLP